MTRSTYIPAVEQGQHGEVVLSGHTRIPGYIRVDDGCAWVFNDQAPRCVAYPLHRIMSIEYTDD